ncbi:Glycosyl transferases group 1 [Rubripirellula obstinata]|uniref:Glycosyl transferases group 1 n=2 Tax=Rubripirellula obstinata TaxID=406547 RepID=A0A5B1CF68_9BACT|nr:Glycosyl transferases group 1 [Rubripirellula obstinata]
MRRLLSDYDCVVFYSNPRYLSTVMAASLREAMGRLTVLRNHFKTAGASRLTEKIRLRWSKRFKNHLVYMPLEIDEMRASGFCNHNLAAWGNGLDSDRILEARAKWSSEKLYRWQVDRGLNSRPSLLAVGRHIAKNQYELLFELISAMEVDARPNLILIGSGPLTDQYRSCIEELELDDQVSLPGEIYDEEELAPYFLSADLLVHPGAIGLTAIHALNYGLPVVTHSSRTMQMPEFTSLKDGVNSFLFPANGGIEELRAAVERGLTVVANHSYDDRKQSRNEISKEVAANFSTEAMANRTLLMLDQLLAR